MNTIRKFLIACCFGVLVLSSCKLTEVPVSEATPETLFNTPEGLRNGINGVYAKLRSLYGSQMGFTLTTMGTDLFQHGKDGGYKYLDNYDAQTNSSVSYFADLWSDCYQAINAANTILAYIDKSGITDAQKKQYSAEVKFLRAHFYYWLTVQFGDVVLNTTETKGVNTTAVRTAKEEIWKLMREDTQFAVDNLNWTADAYGKVTKGAALHQLAQVLLLMKDYKAAANAAKKLINEGPHKLLPVYQDVFKYENQVNTEVIFAAQYTNDLLQNGSGNQGHAFFTPAYDQFPGLKRDLNQGGRPYTRFRPTPFFCNLFNPNDSRFEATFRYVWIYNNSATLPAGKVLGDTVVWQISAGVTSKIAPNTDNMHWGIKKHDDATRASVQDLAGFRDFFIFRLSDTYLLAAEALMLDGNATEGVTYLNKVRERAAKPGKTMPVLAASALTMDEILDERAREFGGEENRWMDLARTGKLVERVKRYNPNSGTIKDFHGLRPIPQIQIDLSTVKFSQNTGY